MDEAPTVVMQGRKPAPAADDEYTLVDADDLLVDARTTAVEAAAPKPARHLPGAPASTASTQPPRPTAEVPRPRTRSTPPPLPPSVAPKTRGPIAAVAPTPAKRPLPPRPRAASLARI
jgi:hypothetical protein